MVTHLISSLNQGFPNIIFPHCSPQDSPSSTKHFFSVTDHEQQFFMEFSCMNKPLGRILIKAMKGAGQAALEFECLMTGQYGFGYKGSRVYACCKDDWCLMGDLLYQEPVAKQENTERDPRFSDNHRKEEEERKGDEGPGYRQLYRGGRRVVRLQEVTKQPQKPGVVVAVASDYDVETCTWTLGPQIKICLNETLIRSGCVLGTVTKGMEVVQQLSRMGGRGYEPLDRITINNCGVL